MRKKSYSSSETAVCANCKGEGTITISGQHIGHGRYDDDTTETCEVCEGTGLVTVKRDTVVTISSKHAKGV